MRLDRFLTLNVVQPLRPSPNGMQPDNPVPILMYHSISGEPEPGVGAYYKTNTSPTVFRRHMQWLAGHNYRAVGLNQVVAWLSDASTYPKGTAPSCQLSTNQNPLVVITFDDGFANFYTEAFPILQEYGFSATVFLPTAFIQHSRRSFKGTNCLTWNEVRELRTKGIEFGSHTVNHPKLVELSWKEISTEIGESKKELERQFGEPVTTFAYPFAFPQARPAFVQGFRNLLAESGYTCCVTTRVGCVHQGDDCYSLKRLPVNSLDDSGLFQAKLQGNYDWLGVAQTMIKRIKRTSTNEERQNHLASQVGLTDLNRRES